MPQILVEFIPDFTKLESSLDALVSNGVLQKGFADAFRAAGKESDTLAGKIKTQLSEQVEGMGKLDAQSKKLYQDMVEGFLQGATQALDEAGISMTDFIKKVSDPKPKVAMTTLMTELRKTTNQMAELHKQGLRNSVQYEELAKKASQYKKSIREVNEELRRSSSETRSLDILIGGATMLTSVFGAATAATQLFGNENEDVQKAMAKTNAIMALLMSLQQITLELKKKDNILTAVQIGLQKAWTWAIGGSSTALKVLRVAMLSTGVGILIAGLGFLVSKLFDAKSNADKLADALERLKDKNKELNESIVREAEIEIAVLESKDAKQSDVLKRKLEQVNQEIDANRDLRNSQQNLVKAVAEFDAKVLDSKKVLDALNETKKTGVNLDVQAYLLSLQIQKATADEAKKAKEKADADAKKAAAEAKEKRDKAIQAAKEERATAFSNAKLRTELELKLAQEGSAEELTLKKRLLLNTLQIDLENEKLGLREKQLLIKNYFKAVEKLSLDSVLKQHAQSRDNEQAVLEAQIQQLNISAKEKEKLTVSILEIEQAREIAAAEGNKIKEAEIDAKYERKIADARFQIRKDEFDKEAMEFEQDNADRVRKLNKIIETEETKEEAKRRLRRERFARANQSDETKIRVAAVDELTGITIAGIEKEKQFYAKAFLDKQISAEDYANKIQELNNKEVDATQSAEDKKTAIIVKANDDRLKSFQELADKVITQFLDGLSQLDALAKAFSDARIQRVDDEMNTLKALHDANTISDKEFVQRQKQLDEKKRRLQREEAIREKSMAIFVAVIQGALAVIKAMPNPFAVAVTAALVAAQIATIAAKPIPKFGRGTKSAPKGLAEVGETGKEYIVSNGKGALVDHQIVWLKGGETIYNPKETAAMLPYINAPVVSYQPPSITNNNNVDYHKLAKSIGDEIVKHPRNVISLDEDGFSHHVMEKGNRTKYKNKRYTFND